VKHFALVRSHVTTFETVAWDVVVVQRALPPKLRGLGVGRASILLPVSDATKGARRRATNRIGSVPTIRKLLVVIDHGLVQKH
jgi:hypothetical protein